MCMAEGTRMARTRPRETEQRPNSVTQKVLRNSPVQLSLLGTLRPGRPVAAHDSMRATLPGKRHIGPATR